MIWRKGTLVQHQDGGWFRVARDCKTLQGLVTVRKLKTKGELWWTKPDKGELWWINPDFIVASVHTGGCK
jgi:hypothetical protein